MVSIFEIVLAAKNKTSIGSAPSPCIIAVFEHEPSWLYAHYIPALRFDLSDLLGCHLSTHGGGHGCFWAIFGFQDLLIEDWRRIERLFTRDAVRELCGKYGAREITIHGSLDEGAAQNANRGCK